jgi:hypothetical protein
MNHADVEEHGFIERYHRGDLPADEEMLFEEHYLGCAECQENLTFARGFRKGVRAMAAEDLSRQTALLGAGLLAWLSRRGRGMRVGLTLAVLFAALVPPVWLVVENRRLAGELVVQEGVSPAVLLLSAHRDAPGEPAAVLDPGQIGQGPVVLAFDAGDDPRFESFRVTIEDHRGAAVFVREGLRPNALEVLMISFPVHFFPPGDYRLRVAGTTGDGRAVELDGYSFRVAAAP